MAPAVLVVTLSPVGAAPVSVPVIVAWVIIIVSTGVRVRRDMRMFLVGSVRTVMFLGERPVVVRPECM